MRRATPWMLVALLCAASAWLTGCATQTTAQSPTVTVEYHFSGFARPVVDWSQAQDKARNDCAKLGYAGAEPLSGARTVCNGRAGTVGCVRWKALATYRCTRVSG
ncbi:MAG TPA: YecR family lipoprotein [Nevskiaceae bacterium]|nr:YecR family lipoprotein [Nevskiaceae bacterium]